MLKIGLTGGIGSGKSTVAGVFESLGVPVYSADAAARRLMNEDPDIIRAIRAEFGDEAYLDGRLNRRHLSSLVFSDKARLLRLNAIVHPATIRDGEEWLKAQRGPYAIREAALIFESGTQGAYDIILGVRAPAALRIRRVMARDHATREAVMARMKGQIDERVKLLLCDEIVDNDEVHPLIPQVLGLHKRWSQTA